MKDKSTSFGPNVVVANGRQIKAIMNYLGRTDYDDLIDGNVYCVTEGELEDITEWVDEDN